MTKQDAENGNFYILAETFAEFTEGWIDDIQEELNKTDPCLKSVRFCVNEAKERLNNLRMYMRKMR